MKSLLFASLFLAIFAIITPLVAGAQLQDDDLYTPAELKRNGQRKALGLPPIKPRALRKKPKKTVGKVAKVQSWPEKEGMAPFSVPEQTFTGYISVRATTAAGPLIGYLQTHQIVIDRNAATLYTYTTSGGLVEISAVDSGERMCIAAGFYGQVMQLGFKNFHLPRHTFLSTPEGDPPHHDQTRAALVETTVFSIDGDTGEMGFSHPEVYTVLRDTLLYYTGDVEAFQEYIDAPIIPAALVWVPHAVSS
ncbi:hypothetical protein BD779DRAFT_1672257 [Infundibulicybe gibba]|nr:hypothetical protein BD779DRAFT_1672257 [Infundibulicybe gibba]